MRTKAYHAFESKIAYFDDDLDLVDVLRESVLAGNLSEPSGDYVLKNIDPEVHAHLKRRKNSDGARRLLINHLRKTVYSSYIKDIYEEVTLYLKTVLEKAAENGFEAGRIIGEHSCKFDAKAILEAGNWHTVTRLITESIFQSLEAEKSTLKLLEKISNKLALAVDPELIKEALPYLEVRYFLVHTDGKIPKAFQKENPGFKFNNDYVQLNYEFVTGLKDSVKKLIKEFDKKIVENGLLKSKDLQQ